MTGIETIRIEGWGGATELCGLTVEADYQPGVFEAAELLASALSVATAGGGLVLGLALMVLDYGTLASICYGSALVSLCAAVYMWCRAFDGVRARGARHIHLSRGWVEVDNQIRWLRDATLDVETVEVAWIPTFSRLSLVFPDGVQIPVVQGPHRNVSNLVHALRYAPCVATPTRRRAA